MDGNSALLVRYGRSAALAAKEQPVGSRDVEALNKLADLVKARGGFFCSFAPDVLAEICQRLVYRSLPPNATCLQEGYPVEGIVILATGRLRLRRRPARHDGDDDVAPSPASPVTGERHLSASSAQGDAAGPSEPPAVAFFAKIKAMKAIAAKLRALRSEKANPHQGSLRASLSEPALAIVPDGRPSNAGAASQQQLLDVPWRSVNSPGTELAQSWLGRPSLSPGPAMTAAPPLEKEKATPLSMRLADVVQELAKNGAAKEPDLGRTASEPSFAGAFASFCENIGMVEPQPEEPPRASPSSRSPRPPPGSAGTGTLHGRGGTNLVRKHASAADLEGQEGEGEEMSRSESSLTSLADSQHNRALRSPILAHLREAAEAEFARQAATKEVALGQLLGVRACLSEHTATCTAVALEPCEVLTLPVQAFWECLDLESTCRHAVRERSLLAAMPGLRAMERDKFRHLVGSFRTIPYRRGAVLCAQGEVRHPGTEGDRLHILMEGEARIVARPSRPPRSGRGIQGQEVDDRPQPRYLGVLLPGQVVNAASQLLGLPEPFSVLVESAEATIMDITRSELSRLIGSGLLDDLRVSAESTSRWRAQHLEASQETIGKRTHRPPQRPAGFAAPSGPSPRGLPEELMHEGRQISKKDFAQRRSPPDARAGLGPEELLGVATTAATSAGRSLQLLTAGAAASASREAEEAAMAHSATAGGNGVLSSRLREGRVVNRTLRLPKKPAVADGLLWPTMPSCNPTGGTTNSTLLEQTQRFQETQDLETTLVPSRPSGLANTWSTSASSSLKSPALVGAALSQLTTSRTELNESLTAGQLERLAMRGDAALLVPVCTVDPMDITALVPTQEPPAPVQPAPPPAPAQHAKSQRRTPLTVKRRPWLSSDRLATGARQLPPELEQTLPAPSLVPPSENTGSSTGQSASSQTRVLVEEPAAPLHAQLESLGEALGLLGELHGKDAEREETPSGGVDPPAAGFWDALYASVGHAQPLEETTIRPPRAPSRPKSAGSGPRPPSRPLRPHQAPAPPRPRLGPQRLKGLTPVHTPSGHACLRRAAPLHVHGISHWLDSGPVTAR